MKINFNSRFTERFLIFFNVLVCTFSLCTIFLEFILRDSSTKAAAFSDFLILIFYFIYILFIEICCVFVMQIFVNYKTRFSFHIRIIFLFLAFSLLISYIFRNLFNAPAILFFTLLQYILTQTLYKGFILHDNFEEVCENKKGLNLQQTLAKDKYVAQEFVQNISNLKTILIAVSIILTTLAFISGISFKNKSILPYIFTFLYILSSFGICELLSIYEKEIYYAFLGLEKVFDLRSRIFFFSMIFVFICLLAGLLLSSNNQILKKEYFQWFFDLFKQKQKKAVQVQPPPIPQMPDMNNGFGNDGLLEFKSEDSNPLGKMIVLVLQYTLIISAIIGFLIFLIKPVFKKGFAVELKKHNFRKILADFFEKISEMFKNLFRKNPNFIPYATTGTKSFTFQMKDFLTRTKKSKEKKAELDRLTKEFVKIISWGEEKQIFYKKNQAPAEYTEVLYSQTKIDDLHKIGFLFEKALYSKDLLSKEEEKEYKEDVQKVIEIN